MVIGKRFKEPQLTNGPPSTKEQPKGLYALDKGKEKGPKEPEESLKFEEYFSNSNIIKRIVEELIDPEKSKYVYPYERCEYLSKDEIGEVIGAIQRAPDIPEERKKEIVEKVKEIGGYEEQFSTEIRIEEFRKMTLEEIKRQEKLLEDRKKEIEAGLEAHKNLTGIENYVEETMKGRKDIENIIGERLKELFSFPMDKIRDALAKSIESMEAKGLLSKKERDLLQIRKQMLKFFETGPGATEDNIQEKRTERIRDLDGKYLEYRLELILLEQVKKEKEGMQKSETRKL